MKQTSYHAAPGKGFQALDLVAAVASFLLIVLGGVVRVTESGLGCPDWPLCHGQVIPPLEFHVLIEYSHRLLASVVSVLILALSGLTVWRYRYDAGLLAMAGLGIVLLVVQIVLGGVTVLLELPGSVVTAHLAVSQAILAVLLVAWVWAWSRGGASRRARTGAQEARQSRLYRRGLAAAVAVYVVTLSGSYVVGANATYACDAWPLCTSGSLVPQDSFQWTHMIHRILAAGVMIQVLLVGWRSWQHRLLSPSLGKLGLTVIGLMVVQILVGALNPMTDFQADVRATHLAMASAVFGALVVLTLVARRTELGLEAGVDDTAAGGPLGRRTDRVNLSGYS